MTRRQVTVALGAAVALQLLVLAGMVAGAAMPRWTGTEIRVETVPVEAAPAGGDAAERRPRSSGTRLVCGACGASNERDARFCKQCGAEL